MDDNELDMPSPTAPAIEEDNDNQDRSRWRSYVECSLAIVGGVLALVYGCVLGTIFLLVPLWFITCSITAFRLNKFVTRFDTATEHLQRGYVVSVRSLTDSDHKTTYYGTFTYQIDEAGQSIQYKRELQSEWLYSQHRKNVAITFVPGYPGSGHPLKVVKEMKYNPIGIFFFCLLFIAFGYTGYLCFYWASWEGGETFTFNLAWMVTILCPLLLIPELASRDYRRMKDNLLNGAKIDESTAVHNLTDFVQAEKAFPCVDENLTATDTSQDIKVV